VLTKIIFKFFLYIIDAEYILEYLEVNVELHKLKVFNTRLKLDFNVSK